MKQRQIASRLSRRFIALEVCLLTVIILVSGLSHRLRADTGTCGGANVAVPFTDVMSSGFFCQIAEAFFTGLTSGTSATTFTPSANVTREQMAAFITRTLDQALRRGSRRSALDQFWQTNPQALLPYGLGVTRLGGSLKLAKSDGVNVWVADAENGNVYQVRASDGVLLETWNRAEAAYGVLCAAGRVFVTGQTSPGQLYLVPPCPIIPPCPVIPVATNLGAFPAGIAFDGSRIWTANAGSVSIITPGTWSVTTVTGFGRLTGIIFDGTNIWVTEAGSPGALRKVSGAGPVPVPVIVGNDPGHPAFDGKNIWVPNTGSNTVTVVRASDGLVLATLSGNGLNGPFSAAFDGERILVTNSLGGSLSLWKATDLTALPPQPIQPPCPVSPSPFGACSDGQQFWITVCSQLVRL